RTAVATHDAPTAARRATVDQLTQLALDLDGFVLPLARTQPSAKADRIELGRGHQRDLVIAHSSVSRLHAYFMPVPAGEWSVVDVGSANGTRVGRRRLQPGQPIALHACAAGRPRPSPAPPLACAARPSRTERPPSRVPPPPRTRAIRRAGWLLPTAGWRGRTQYPIGRPSASATARAPAGGAPLDLMV